MQIHRPFAFACLLALACKDASAPAEVIDDTPVIAMDTVVRTVAGADAACALDATGLSWCWGDAGSFLYGATGAGRLTIPTASTAGTFASLSRGNSQHVCGIRADGLGVCWGRGGSGQTGHGVSGTAAGDAPDSIVGGYRWKAIYTGRLATCGITVDNDGYCWGLNQWGEIGNSGLALGTSSSVPLLVDGNHKWKRLAPGWVHTCGIDTAGVAWCWGNNSSGQLGTLDSDTASHKTPIAVQGGGFFIEIVTGWRHTCGINTSNNVFCWGGNAMGQLGNGTISWAGAPTLIASGHKFAQIAVSMTASAAGITVPPVGSQNDRGSTCALTVAGVAYCWGYNGTGQLGDGTLTSRLVPTRVFGDNTFTSIAMGSAHTCARRLEQVMCWGANDLSQLGSTADTLIISSVPQLTRSPFNNH